MKHKSKKRTRKYIKKLRKSKKRTRKYNKSNKIKYKKRMNYKSAKKRFRTRRYKRNARKHYKKGGAPTLDEMKYDIELRNLRLKHLTSDAEIREEEEKILDLKQKIREEEEVKAAIAAVEAAKAEQEAAAGAAVAGPIPHEQQPGAAVAGPIPHEQQPGEAVAGLGAAATGLGAAEETPRRRIDQLRQTLMDFTQSFKFFKSEGTENKELEKEIHDLEKEIHDLEQMIEAEQASSITDASVAAAAKAEQEAAAAAAAVAQQEAASEASEELQERMTLLNYTSDPIYKHPSDGVLWLGTLSSANDIEYLEYIGCKHIISVIDAGVPTMPPEYGHLYIPVKDNDKYKLEPYFDLTSEFIEKNISSGKNVLVHCSSGVSRSSTIVIAYLMNKLKITLRDAYRYVYERRNIILPGIGFFRELMALDLKLYASNSMGLKEYYAYSVQKSVKEMYQKDVSYEDCFSEIGKTGYDEDTEILQAIENISKKYPE